MVNVDSVYQKVLAVCNKEQRGYITPQEFDLFADKAQLDLVNNYFHQKKMALLKPTNNTESSDVIDIIDEKLAFIRKTVSGTIGGGTTTVGTGTTTVTTTIPSHINLPSDLYRLAGLYQRFGPSGTGNVNERNYTYKEIVKVSKDEVMRMTMNPLTAPNIKRPVYVYNSAVDINNATSQELKVHLYPQAMGAGTSGTLTNDIKIDYYKKPNFTNKVHWGYVVVNQKALYNYSTSTNFDLHPSEEEPLVSRILELSGISMQRDDVLRAATTDKQITKQEQNS